MGSLLFAFVPGFYAEAERVRDASLRDRPLIVGGDPRKRGLVQSATPEALAAGVELGMEVVLALDRCPTARAVPTDMKHYREVSGRLRVCFRDGARAMEPLGLESAFVEPRAEDAERQDVEVAAVRLRNRVREELDLPLQVGISARKFLARIAAEDAGAEGILRIPSGEENAFLHPLAPSRLPGVGPRTVERLAELGVSSIRDLLSVPENVLESELGKHGLRILDYARCRDDSVLRENRRRKSLSREHTFAAPEIDRGVIDERLQRLAQEVMAALGQEGLAGRRIAVRASYEGGESQTRTRTLPSPPHSAVELAGVAMALLGLTRAGSRPLRRLALSMAELSTSSEHDRQLELF